MQADPPAKAFVPVSHNQARIIIVLLALLLVVQIVGFSFQTTAQQWDYRLEAPKDQAFEATMTQLGRERWELVSARRAKAPVPGGAIEVNEMIFKRPKRW